MIHGEGEFIAGSGLKLFVQKWAPSQGSKAVIAIVHGIGEHSSRYMNMVNYFIPLGYTIYAYDLRGHGRSQGKRGHIMHWEEFRSDLFKFLQFIKSNYQDLPLFLFGHSLGGLIVLDYCIHQPEGIRAVIASSPALSEPGVPRFLIFLSKILSRIWPVLTIKTKLDVTALSRDPAVIENYSIDPLVHNLASVRLGTEFSTIRELTLLMAAGFKPPLLIYHGLSDRIVPPEGTKIFYNAIRQPDKELRLFEGGYHETHNDLQKEWLFEIIHTWIKKHL
jgi:alpha-beta hydrolase superfamily lysophospholipase